MGKASFIERRNSRNDVNQNYGLNRESKQGTSTYANTPPGRSNVSISSDKFLRTDGGKLHAPIGFDKKTIIIDGSNAIDIEQGGGNFVPRVVLDGTTSTTLDTISNPLFEGQKIYLQAYSSGTITIGTAGNIQTAMSLTANHVMELIYDFDVAKWIMPEDNTGSGGSGGDDLGNHTATQNLEMGAFDIHWGTQGSIRNLSTTMYHYSGTTLTCQVSPTLWSFRTNIRPHSDSAYTLGTSSRYWSDLYTDHIEMNGDIDLNSNDIVGGNQIIFTSSGNYILGQDGGGNMEFATTGGAFEYFVGGVPQFVVNSGGTDLYNTMDVRGNQVEGMGKLLFDSTGTISGTEVGFASLVGTLYANVQASDSFFYRTGGTTRFRIHDEGIEILNTDSTRAWLSIDESTTVPTSSTVSSDECKLFCVDSGGKTILKVQFDTGSPITLATEV